MSDSEKLQRRFDALTIEFVHPFLHGEGVSVGQALAPGAIQYFQHAQPSEALVDSEIFDALHRSASSLAPLETVPWPNRDLLLISMALHNLLLLTDPKLDRMGSRGACVDILEWTREIVDAIEIPQTRGDALARYALLEPVFGLRRRDVVVKNWAYTYRFFGRPVPDNVVAFPKLRWVRQTSTFPNIRKLWETVDVKIADGVLEVFRFLLSRSPVTEMIHLRDCPEFRFGLASLGVLSDPLLRGGIARVMVERGEWIMAPRLGFALRPEFWKSATPQMIFVAVALVFEIHLTATLQEPGPGLPGRLDLSDADAARFAAVVSVMLNHPSMLPYLRAVRAPDRAELVQRATALKALIEPSVMDEAQRLVESSEPIPFTPSPVSEARS